MSRKMPAREEKSEPSRMARPEQEGTRASEERGKPRAGGGLGATSFRFDDPYWDDVFDSWHDPTLRTCCRCF